MKDDHIDALQYVALDLRSAHAQALLEEAIAKPPLLMTKALDVGSTCRG